METVPETETPGETRTAVVLMLIGPTIINKYIIRKSLIVNFVTFHQWNAK